MKVSSKLMVVAVAGALTAAAAVPALALEHEFHGMIRTQYQLSNFNGSYTGQGFYNPVSRTISNPNFDSSLPVGPANPATLTVPIEKKSPTANTFDQRARLTYLAKANDFARLVAQFELDYSYWGNSSYTAGRNTGGAIGADSVNLETKHLYLQLKPSGTTSLRIGMQPFDDAFKGVFVSGDMVGAGLSAAYGKSNALVGFYRFDDRNSGGITGKDTRDMFALDYKYAVTDTLKVGGAYYFVNDDRGTGEPGFLSQQSGNQNRTHTVGVNAEKVFGPLTVDGFLLYQFGELEDIGGTGLDRDVSAYAANVGARLKVGPGTARSEVLYVSGEGSATGDTSAFQSINSTDADTEHGFYNNEMYILGRDKYALTIDNAILYSSNNMDQGLVIGTIGYDLPVSNKLTVSANAGFGAIAKKNAVSTARDSKYVGTEVNVEAGYKWFENVNLVGRAAYVFLGDYYKGVAAGGQDPDDPYAVRLLAEYIF